MEGNGPSWWDKLDSISRFLSMVVLGTIPLVISIGAERIARATRESELVQSLIQDLTMRDVSTRQNIALIALDHAVEHDARGNGLVAGVAHQVWQDRGESNADRDVALLIIESRHPELFAQLRARTDEYASDPDVRPQLRSQPTVASDSESLAGDAEREERAPPEARLIADVYSDNVVYIQFNPSSFEPARARGLRDFLAQGQLNVPPVEAIGNVDFPNDVRFVHDEDRGLATEVATRVAEFLEVADPSFEVKQISTPHDVQRGHIEVWVNLSRVGE